jgi:diguanylate cyclase (GGDEF)-like protein/hemerythrin-like metal-binding protein
MITAPTQSGFLDPSIRAIFHDFPVPLVVVASTGRLELANLSFEATYNSDHLDAAQWARLAADCLDHWKTDLMEDRSGELVPVRVQALAINDWFLVAFEEIAHGGAMPPTLELQALRDRVQELEHASATDHLTGAWNRGHLDRTIQAELARAVRYQQPVTLLLMDVDHFKAVNDTHGHAAGDAVLRELVQRIRGAVRSSDIVFRWGGEEFVVLATGSGYRAGERLADKLRQAVADQEFAGTGRVTISVGVAELDAHEDAAAWFHRLDDMLYRAKEGGRNRVAVDRRGNSNCFAAGRGGIPLRLLWEEAYESGHALLDRQHQHMFELTNSLIDATMGRGSTQQRIDQVLDELLEHIRMHFSYEEALLEGMQYQHLPMHCGAHAQLLARAVELRELAAQGKADPGALVTFLAKDVVSRHILAVDRHFFPLLAAASKANVALA